MYILVALNVKPLVNQWTGVSFTCIYFVVALNYQTTGKPMDWSIIYMYIFCSCS